MRYKWNGYDRKHRSIMKPILLNALNELFPNEKWIVHHKDGNKMNNDLFNLEIMEHHKHMSLHNRNQIVGKYVGTWYSLKNRNPWTRVWMSQIIYNKHRTSLGYYEDPISAGIVFNLVRNEIRGD